jgi:hypothetical protein
MYIATPVDCVRAALEMSSEMFTAAFYAIFDTNEAPSAVPEGYCATCALPEK